MKKVLSFCLALLFSAFCFQGCAAQKSNVEATAAPTAEPTPALTPEDKEIVLTKANFDEMIAGDTPILVDFWASWCAPCMKLAPIVEELANESDGSYRVGKVNVDEQPELAARFEVSGIPLLIVFKNGEEVARSMGLVGKDRLVELIRKEP